MDTTTTATISFGVELGAMTTAPVYESHKRGRNWLAKIVRDPGSPGGLGRTFQESAKGRYFYFINRLTAGDVVEFGADYYTGAGSKKTERWYGVVAEIADDHIAFHHTDTAAQAFKLAKEIAAQAVREGTQVLEN